MKKVVFMMVTCIVMLTSVVFSNAAASIKEAPNVKVIIDGKTTEYKDVPINVNGRTLLPLRAILANLGVSNDDQHITWDGSQNSVTATKDSTKIYLKVDSTNATVNGASVAMDVAPVNYKGRVYIPARFVSQSLGKKVIWDASSESVLIRDEKDFNATKEILDKYAAASKDLTKVKYTADSNINDSISGQNIAINTKLSVEADIKNSILHIISNTKAQNTDINTESYISNDSVYINDPLTKKWQKVKMPITEIQDSMKSSVSALGAEVNDVMYAGLVADTTGKDEIVLKGDVYMDQIFKSLSSSIPQASNIDFSKVYMELYIDKSTYLANKLNMKMIFTVNTNKNGKQMSEKMDMDISSVYSDYNGNFEVAIPEDALKAPEISVDK